jgi:hypothetical protein
MIYAARHIPYRLTSASRGVSHGPVAPRGAVPRSTYAISRDLIHWESQSDTRADSETGRRYREHGRRGSHVLLLRGGTPTSGRFISSGRRGMFGTSRSSRWRLRGSWSIDYRGIFGVFAAAVA